jgi:tRNA threonylcarbamoyladenosine biosynthesis protein TsaB
MRVLALDTSTARGSAALVEDDRVLAEHPGDVSRPYAARLPRELLDVLAAAAAPLASVDAFAIAVGPGSFTGLRIGIACMQGLAQVTGRPMVAVTVLETLGALAAASCRSGDLVGAWVDAHRSDVYSALYEVTGVEPFSLDRLIEREPPHVGKPEEVLRRWTASDGPAHRPLAALAGDGAALHAVCAGRLCAAPSGVVNPPILAGALGRLAVARHRAGGGVRPSTIQPLYVRRPDVEIAREQARHG